MLNLWRYILFLQSLICKIFIKSCFPVNKNNFDFSESSKIIYPKLYIIPNSNLYLLIFYIININFSYFYSIIILKYLFLMIIQFSHHSSDIASIIWINSALIQTLASFISSFYIINFILSRSKYRNELKNFWLDQTQYWRHQINILVKIFQ